MALCVLALCIAQSGFLPVSDARPHVQNKHRVHEVKHLPGFSEQQQLPSRQYTGYIPVGATQQDKHLFYWLVESEYSAASDPVVLWLTGGPGCSSMDAFIYENGPFRFSYITKDGSEANQDITLQPNPYAWSKVATMIYVDSPAGTGLSYSSSNQPTDDEQTTDDLVDFITQLLMDVFPHLQDNELYIAGESYAGVFIPMLASKLVKYNTQAEHQHRLNIKGYAVGNGVADDMYDGNGQVEFAYNMGLIDPPTHTELVDVCQGNFWNITPDSACSTSLKAAYDGFYWLNPYDILEDCYNSKGAAAAPSGAQRALLQQAPAHAKELHTGHAHSSRVHSMQPHTSTSTVPLAPLQWPYAGVLGSQPHGAPVFNWHQLVGHSVPCADRRLALDWLSRASVREALGVASPDVLPWQPCSDTLHYRFGPVSMLGLHRDMLLQGLRVLIYSGDHDFVVPFTGTRAWVYALGLDLTQPYAPWTVEGQVVGFLAKFKQGLTFATVKGAGHMVPQSSPDRALHLITRFLLDEL